MNAYVGTSGYSYDFWRGNFYPTSLGRDEMLAFYARQFRAVEINNTFYRMPKRDVVRRWAQAVPPEFRFSVKASRRITHQKRLRDCEDDLAYLYSVLDPLEDHLGAILFQCAPQLKKDTALLQNFLTQLPAHARAVLELRHRSWYTDEIYELLARHGAVLCALDDDARNDLPLVTTADWGYLRLRADHYDDEGLRAWVARLPASWEHAFVFFKHEQTAPELAQRFIRLAQAH